MSVSVQSKRRLAVLLLCAAACFGILVMRPDAVYADSSSTGSGQTAAVQAESSQNGSNGKSSAAASGSDVKEDAAAPSSSSKDSETADNTAGNTNGSANESASADSGTESSDGYVFTDGRLYKDGVLFTGIYEEKYYRGGVLATGLYEKQYYADGIASDQSGFVTVDGTKYYLSHGTLYTGFHDSCYYKDGARSHDTGFINDNGKQYCVKVGKLFTGIYQSHAYKKGSPAKGLVKLNGSYYYAKSGGSIVKKSFRKVSGSYYYFGKSGKAATGWLTVNGRRRYFSKSGKAYTGTKRIGKRYYRFSSHGAEDKTFSSVYKQIYGKKSGTRYIIAVSRSKTRVLICRKSGGAWKPVHYWRCTVGKSSTPTPAGNFTIGYRGSHFGEGHGYTCWYYTQITGSYLFHSVLYQPYSKSRYVDSRIGGHLSHGCVRLAINNAKWIYQHIPRGTKVVIK